MTMIHACLGVGLVLLASQQHGSHQHGGQQADSQMPSTVETEIQSEMELHFEPSLEGGSPAETRPLQPVQSRGGREQAPEARAFRAQEWRERLSQRDLNAREQSYAELLELARRNERVVEELRAWSRGQDELAWTTRLLLRELERRGTRGALRTFRTDSFGDMQERMQELQQRMERLRAEFERDFLDRGSLGGGSRERDSATPAPMPGPRMQRQVEARQDANGARIEVRTRTGDGPEEVKVYEGKTIEEIYKAHPELRQVEVRPGGDLEQWHGLEGQHAPRSDELAPHSDELAPPRAPLAPQGWSMGRPMVGPDRQPMQRNVLGVMCQPKDGGLYIEEVVEGSLAAQVGLRAGDLLLELNGTPVPAREDVARVLQERRAGEDLVIVIQDANGKRRTLTHRAN